MPCSGTRSHQGRTCPRFAGCLSEATRLPVLLLRYRLAPADPYPAPLDDVLDAYQGLLDQGTLPGRIVFVGHSAGATLTLSALLALGQAGRPMPAGAVAISPITDFTLSGKSLGSNVGRDVVTMTELKQTRSVLARPRSGHGARIASCRRAR
jgi:acetyl esterase/lipase